MKSIILLFTAVPLIFLTACSDPEKAPTGPQAQVSVHEQGWNAAASASFHGKALAAKNFNAAECRPCHGSQFDGGIAGVSCKTCHASFPHPAAGWVAGANAHGAFLKNNAYNLNSCKGCHGQNYGTVKVNTSCLTCHTKQGGPEACNTCHGNFGGDPADFKNIAPPKGLDGETAATTPAVGAHQAHLAYYPGAALAGTCQECHALPQSFAAAGHLDADGKAELLFKGTLANLKTEGGARVPNVSYSAANNSCANTYCHGNWGLLKSGSTRNFAYTADKMEGSNASPKWTDAATAACGSCHGLPPTGHLAAQLTTCVNCHLGVIDATGKIIDNTKHVNGKINVFGAEEPMF
jgi:predicted CxxxxCH...CXXCH cytochrome family protein